MEDALRLQQTFGITFPTLVGKEGTIIHSLVHRRACVQPLSRVCMVAVGAGNPVSPELYICMLCDMLILKFCSFYFHLK